MGFLDFIKSKKRNSVEREFNFSDVITEIYELVDTADLAENTHTDIYDISYDESEDEFYVIGIREGIVYKIEVTADKTLMLGEFERLNLENRNRSKLTVFRGVNNEKRWLSVASVAVLNRVGEIDSRELFDSFIEHAYRTKEFPVLNVYHKGDGSVIGQTDFLHREGYVYIASGIFNDDKFGDAFYKGLKGRNDWGNSIEFSAYSPDVERFRLENGTVIQVPIYKKGINTGITVLREKDAASLFTLHKSRG